jgi:hypothetical protein
MTFVVNFNPHPLKPTLYKICYKKCFITKEVENNSLMKSNSINKCVTKHFATNMFEGVEIKPQTF